MAVRLASDCAVADREPGVVTFPTTTADPLLVRAAVRLVVLVEITERAWLAASWTMKHSGCSSSKAARAAGMGQGQRLNPTLTVAHAGSYEDGDYKVQRMRIEQW